MRFDSPQLLNEWQATGRWPAIHDAIAQMAVDYLTGDRLVDLGCAFGLLGARIVAEAGPYFAMGIDASATTLSLARAAGVPVELVELRIKDTVSVAQARAAVERNHIDIMVCRRILPELFGHDVALGRAFIGAMRAAGVKEVLVQGRVSVESAVNPLRSITEEIELLQSSYDCIAVRGPCAYLRAR